jgi:hypothetical protein
LVFPLGCKKFALFKSVEHINRFKKQHFLNRIEQNNRFKKCIQGVSPKNSTLQGVSHKKKITGRNTKYTYITGGISLFTLNFKLQLKYLIVRTIVLEPTKYTQAK